MGYCPFSGQFSIAKENALVSCHNRECSVSIGVGRARLFGSRHDFWFTTRLLGRDRAFWLCVTTRSSVLRHGPHAAVALGSRQGLVLRHSLAREESLYRDKEFSVTIELATTGSLVTTT